MQNKKSPKIISWLDMGIFPPTILFSCGNSYDELSAYLKKVKAKDWLRCIEDMEKDFADVEYFALHRYLENTKTVHKKHFYYIFIKPRFGFTDYEMVKLAHEVLHVCSFALENILSISREYEAFAYSHSYIMDHCLQLLRGERKP